MSERFSVIFSNEYNPHAGVFTTRTWDESYKKLKELFNIKDDECILGLEVSKRGITASIAKK